MQEEQGKSRENAHMDHTNQENAQTDAPGTDGHAGMAHAGTGHAGMGHAGMEGTELATRVMRPQLLAVTALTLLALAAAALFSASYTNLTYSAEDVGGVIMPPGMVMTRDTPAEAMREMAAVNPGDVGYAAPTDARGDQPLEPRIEDGVKVFDLDVSVIEWNILPNERVAAYAFNR